MKSMTKKGFMIASAVGLSFCMLAVVAPATNVDVAAKTKLNKKKITIKVGKSKKLKIKNLKGKKVKWKTSNKSVVKIKKTGKKTVVKLKGKKAGTATITAKVGKKKFKCKVTVKAAKSNASNNTNNTEVTVITEKEVKQQEAALNKKYEDYGMVRNSGVYSGHSATIIYPSAATKGEYLDDCGIRSVPESGKYYCYFDIVRQNKYKNDSSIKVTYTTDGSIPTLNSYDAGNEVHFKMTSQTPTVKVHIYKDGKLVALYYYTNGHLYANNGEYDE
ncbi:hypothetical protein B5F87_19455 [Eubacterium sp. An3]|nr:hypothetical protein B5F87_19455 [Eubacterium sp. An3]